MNIKREAKLLLNPLDKLLVGYVSDRFEGLAVNGRWSQSAQAGEVLPGAVAFVLSQPIARVNPVKLYHQPVASHFGNNRGTGNRET